MIRVLQWGYGGEVSEITLEQAATLSAGNWVWVDMIDEDPESVRAVGREFGVDATALEESLATTNLPLLEEHRDSIYLVLNGFLTGRGERLVTTEVDIFVGTNYLISIHGSEVPAMESILERIRQGLHPQVTTPAALVAHIGLAGIRRFVPLIEELEKQIDLLEELAMRADPRTITEAHALRRDVILLRRALGPQVEILDDLSDSAHPLIDKDARRAFSRAFNHQNRVLESIEAARSLLGSVLETHRGAVADQTNEIVRVLTVFSAILLPLGLIAGIWGMNFDRMPAVTEAWGFWGLIGLMGVLAVGLWVYFARRGFVGAPRLRELPRSVGLGVIQVGTAPIRVVAEGIESTIRYVGRGGREEHPED